MWVFFWVSECSRFALSLMSASLFAIFFVCTQSRGLFHEQVGGAVTTRAQAAKNKRISPTSETQVDDS